MRPAILLDLVQGNNSITIILRLKKRYCPSEVLGRCGVLPVFESLPCPDSYKYRNQDRDCYQNLDLMVLIKVVCFLGCDLEPIWLPKAFPGYSLASSRHEVLSFSPTLERESIERVI